MQRPAVRPRGRLQRLNLIAAVLIGAALLFSAYSGLRANFTTSSSSPADTAKLNRLLKFDSKPRSSHLVLPEAIIAAVGDSVEKPCKPCEEASSLTSPVVTPLVLAGQATAAGQPKPNTRLFHVVTTAQGFTNHWQARIHYFHYQKQRTACQRQERCDMGGFTRLLHSGVADDLFDEIPTVVVSPLPSEKLKDSGYIVLNRPFAFLTWLKTASIPERYILMAEGDHIFLRPLPNMMVGDAPAAFLFTYMVPEQFPSVVRKFLGPISDAELKLVPRIGNSPTFVSVTDMRLLAPAWYNMTNAIFDDAEAHKEWNWVLEMYGFALAAYKVGLHKEMKFSTDLMAHPPFDTTDKDFTGSPFYLLHYTYPLKFGPSGNVTDKAPFLWEFDKRSFMGAAPPRHINEPPAAVQCSLATTLIRAFNEATEALPCWDEYVATKKVTTVCTPAAQGDAIKASVA